MPSFAVSLAFLLAAGQPPAEPAAATPAAEQAAAPTQEPKMICKYENLTGSRVQKQKICRPESQTAADIDSTKLQRDIARNGDMRVPGERGGAVSSGAGIGN